MLKKAVLFFILHCFVVISTEQHKPKKLIAQHKHMQIQTTNGLVQGKESKTAYAGITFYSFQGIPFAKTPTGKRRFADPEPADNWTGILDATREKDLCVQMTSSNGSEDCLYLNMYTTRVPLENNGSLVPVMIWIYGGGFIEGGAPYNFFKPDYILNEKVVYASIQYRLGVFGFLSTGDDVISGNFGLKDQVMAIKWIHQNVRAFGGNPNKITIVGESAGGTSVSYLAQMPQLNGILSGVIMQSGTSLAQWGLIRDPKKNVIAYANSVGIKSQNTTVILRELRNKSVKQLRSVYDMTSPLQAILNNVIVAFGPVMEIRHKNAVITEKSYPLLQSGRFNRIPHLIGFNSEEGKILLTHNQTITMLTSFYDSNPTNYVPLDINVKQNLAMGLGRKIKDYYSAYSPDVYNKIRFGTDSFFIRPAREHVRLIRHYVPTYFYEFAYEGSFMQIPNQEKIPGVAHAEELKYIFGEDDDLVAWRGDLVEGGRENTLKARKAVDEFRQMRVRSVFIFALPPLRNCIDFTFRNPTPKPAPHLDNVVWDKVSSDTYINYLHIDSKVQNKINPHKKEMNFWDGVYKQYGNPPYGTYK